MLPKLYDAGWKEEQSSEQHSFANDILKKERGIVEKRCTKAVQNRGGKEGEPKARNA